MGRPKKRTRETGVAFVGTRLPRRHIVLKQLPGKHLKIHWMEKHMWCAHKCSVWMKCHGWWWHQKTVTITCKDAASDGFGFLLLWFGFFFPSCTLFVGGALKEYCFALGWCIKVNVEKGGTCSQQQQQLEMVRVIWLHFGNLNQLTGSLHNSPSKVTTALLKLLQYKDKWFSEHYRFNLC